MVFCAPNGRRVTPTNEVGMNYPKWKYHAALAAVVVQDEAADKALGDEWAETPAAFAEQSEDDAANTSKPRGRPRKME